MVHNSRGNQFTNKIKILQILKFDVQTKAHVFKVKPPKGMILESRTFHAGDKALGPLDSYINEAVKQSKKSRIYSSNDIKKISKMINDYVGN